MIEDLNSVVLPDERAPADREALRRVQFSQANASLALEGLRVDATDADIQSMIARGELTHDEAVAIYVRRAVKGGAR